MKSVEILGSIMKQMMLALTLILVAWVNKTNAYEGINISTHKIESKEADSILEFKIALPWGYDKTKAYPVMYTTAGGSRFEYLVHQVDWLSHVAMGPMPQFIIVNVPQVTVPSDLHPKFVAASGVANKLQFSVIEKELIPYINKSFKTQGFNLLEGYSSNGNFVLHTYLEKAELFDGYLVHSPALELDKSGLVEKFNKLNANATNEFPSLYLSLGPFESNKPLFEKIKSKLEYSNKIVFADLSDHNFLSVATLSLNNSVEWTFSDLSPNVQDFEIGGIESVNAYYSKLEKKYNKAMDSSSTIIDLSFHYANKKNNIKALETIDALISSAPENVYYLTRKASVQKLIGKVDGSKQTLMLAQEIATKNKNDDALSYIKGELSKL